MIYMTGNDGKLKVIILETANLDELKKGRPATTPDGEVLIAWTPDPQWLAARLVHTEGDGVMIGQLIDEAAKRPQRPRRFPRLSRRRTRDACSFRRVDVQAVRQRILHLN